MITGIQIVAILFALIMAYLTFTHFKRKEFSFVDVVLWQGLWVGFIILVIFPHSLDFIVETFKLNRSLDFFMIVGFMVVIGLTFRNLIVSKKLENRMEKFIRSEALKDFAVSESQKETSNEQNRK